MSKQYFLLITCTVGYGHQAAAMNVEQSLRQNHPGIEVIRLDTRQYFPPGVGTISDQWDTQIRKGRLGVSQVVKAQGPYEAFCELFLDRRLTRDILKLFTEHEIIAVYDTQPMFTPTLYKAFSKACAGRPFVYHKIFTDLPTPRNYSFFSGIKRIRFVDDLQLRIHAPEPMLAPHESAESFWKTHCKLPAIHIDETFALPVHPNYLNRPNDVNLLNVAVEPEWKLQLPLPDNAYVTTLMLGSQGVNAIYDYAMQYLEQLQNRQPDQPHYFFVACSKNEGLYNALQNLLITHPLHQNTAHRIIPLKMQDMNAVASLMWRSNQIIIRSGGISSLEQLALGRARIDNPPKLWIHSGYKGNDPAALLNHIYTWERGNAEYLMKFSGANVTAPQLIDFFDI
jgi:hypothetical protein